MVAFPAPPQPPVALVVPENLPADASCKVSRIEPGGDAALGHYATLGREEIARAEDIAAERWGSGTYGFEVWASGRKLNSWRQKLGGGPAKDSQGQLIDVPKPAIHAPPPHLPSGMSPATAAAYAQLPYALQLPGALGEEGPSAGLTTRFWMKQLEQSEDANKRLLKELVQLRERHEINVEQLREKFEAEINRTREQIAEARATNARLEADLNRERSNGEVRALTARLEALAARPSTDPAQGIKDGIELASKLMPKSEPQPRNSSLADVRDTLQLLEEIRGDGAKDSDWVGVMKAGLEAYSEFNKVEGKVAAEPKGESSEPEANASGELSKLLGEALEALPQPAEWAQKAIKTMTPIGRKRLRNLDLSPDKFEGLLGWINYVPNLKVSRVVQVLKADPKRIGWLMEAVKACQKQLLATP